MSEKNDRAPGDLLVPSKPDLPEGWWFDEHGRLYDRYGSYMGSRGTLIPEHPISKLGEKLWDAMLAASEPLAAEPAETMEIDAGVLESFLALMALEKGDGALETIGAILAMASSLKRLNAPRYSIIKGPLRLDIEDGKIRFIGAPKDRRSYDDLKSKDADLGQ